MQDKLYDLRDKFTEEVSMFQRLAGTVKYNLNACFIHTGMAASHLNHLGATTIHRLFGIMDGRHDSQYMAELLLKDDRPRMQDCRRKLREIEVLVINEISMLSQKTFNQI